MKVAAALLVLVLFVTTAHAQSGFLLVAPNTQRNACTAITSPITNQSWCADGTLGPTNYTWKVWNGTTWQPIAGGGGGGGGVCGFSNVLTISNVDTSGSVTFTTPMADTSYQVALATFPVTGTPPFIVAEYFNKTTAGFSIALSSAPGTGNTVGVSWIVTGGVCVSGHGTTGDLTKWVNGPGGVLGDFAGSTCAGGQFATAISAAGALTCSPTGAAPGGGDKAVQFNDGGSTFGGATLSWDKTTNVLFPTVTTDLGTNLISFRSLYATGSASGGTGFAPGVAIGTDLTFFSNVPVIAAETILGNDYGYDAAFWRAGLAQMNVGFFRARGTYQTPTAANNGDGIADIIFSGFDGAINRSSSRISATYRVAGSSGGDLSLLVNDTAGGVHVWTMQTGGTMLYAALTFANLGTPGNGSMVYCSDCDPTATLVACTHVGAQTGAFAYRVNGAWKCMG